MRRCAPAGRRSFSRLVRCRVFPTPVILALDFSNVWNSSRQTLPTIGTFLPKSPPRWKCGLAVFRAAGSCACIRSRGLTGSTGSPPPAPLISAQAPSHQMRLRRIPGHAVKSPRVIAYATSRPFSARPIQPRRVSWRRRQRRPRRTLRRRSRDDAGPCPRWGQSRHGRDCRGFV